MTVPFYHDKPEYHFRIHSPKTIRRLLEYAGFEIERWTYRGLAIRTPNWLVAFAALLLFPFLGRDSLRLLNEKIYVFHNILSGAKRLNRLTNGYGALIVARKISSHHNSIAIQKSAFSRKY